LVQRFNAVLPTPSELVFIPAATIYLIFSSTVRDFVTEGLLKTIIIIIIIMHKFVKRPCDPEIQRRMAA